MRKTIWAALAMLAGLASVMGAGQTDSPGAGNGGALPVGAGAGPTAVSVICTEVTVHADFLVLRWEVRWPELTVVQDADSADFIVTGYVNTGLDTIPFATLTFAPDGCKRHVGHKWEDTGTVSLTVPEGTVCRCAVCGKGEKVLRGPGIEIRYE